MATQPTNSQSHIAIDNAATFSESSATSPHGLTELAQAVVEPKTLSPASEIVINAPAAGERLEFTVAAGTRLVLQNIDLATGQIQEVDGGLLITLGNGGVIFLAGFISATETNNPPVIEIAGIGTLEAAQLVAAVSGGNLDVAPAAGAGAGSAAAHGGGASFREFNPGEIGEGLTSPGLSANEDFLRTPPAPEADISGNSLPFGDGTSGDTSDAPSAATSSAGISEPALDGSQSSGPFYPGSASSSSSEVVSGTLSYNFGADGPANTAPFVWGNVSATDKDPSDGSFSGLYSGGDQVTIVHVSDTLIAGQVISGSGPYVGETIFTLELNDVATGSYTYTQIGPFDHPDSAASVGAGGQTGSDDPITITFTYEIKDSTGDAKQNTLAIDVTDDGPTASISLNGTPALLVDETDGVAASGEADPIGGNLGTSTILVADLLSDTSVFGADGPKDGSQSVGTSYTLSLLVSDGAASNLTDTASDSVVTLHVISGTEIQGWYAGDDGSDPVFSLSINADTGELSITQFRAVVHGSSDNPDTSEGVTLASDLVGVRVTVEDGDGDTSSDTTNLNGVIQFLDDGSTAMGADYVRVADGGFNGTASGDLYYDAGSDGLQVGNAFSFIYDNFDASFYDGTGLKATTASGEVLLSNGDTVYYAMWDGGNFIAFDETNNSTATLYGVTDLNGTLGDEVLSISLNANGTFDINMLAPLDNTLTLVPISLKSGVSGGNAGFYALGSASSGDNSDDVLVTPAQYGTNTTVNSNAGGLGAGGGSDAALPINSDEGMRFQFVRNLIVTGNGAHKTETHDAAIRVIYDVTLTIGAVHSQGTTSVIVADPTGGSGDPGDYNVTTSGGTSVTWGSVEVSGTPVYGWIVEGLEEGDTLTVSHTSSITDLSVYNGEALSGHDGFVFSDLSYNTITPTNALDMSLDYTVTDGDGDSSTASIDFTIDPNGFHMGSLDAYTVTNISGETVYGEEGSDVINGNAGADILIGGEGEDILNGNGGSDILVGGYGNDTLVGGTGADKLYGNGGDDTLTFDASDLLIDGGLGIDTLVVAGPDADLTIFSGEMNRIDAIDLNTMTSTLTINASDVLQSDDHILRVEGDALDVVNVLGGAWNSLGGDGGGYNVFTSEVGDTTVTLLIDAQITNVNIV